MSLPIYTAVPFFCFDLVPTIGTLFRPTTWAWGYFFGLSWNEQGCYV